MAFIVFKKVFRTCSSAKERNFKSISESDFFLELINNITIPCFNRLA